MYSALEVFVHGGPVSLVAMSDLDWERSLLGESSFRQRPREPAFAAARAIEPPRLRLERQQVPVTHVADGTAA